jgi:hypothetical protein
MKAFLLLGFLFISVDGFAIPCDCEVRVFSPMTAAQKPTTFKAYQLEEYGSYSVKNQKTCRQSCQDAFEKDMPTDRLHALLLSYTQSLIQEKALGFNCTGLTTVKFPVRVKASLGQMGLGNVSDTIEIVTHEEVCF